MVARNPYFCPPKSRTFGSEQLKIPVINAPSILGPWIPAKVAEALVDVDRDSLITTHRLNYTGFVPDSPERNSRRNATERAWLPTSGSPSQELQLVCPVITFPKVYHRFSTNWRDAELLFVRVAVGTTRGSPGSRSVSACWRGDPVRMGPWRLDKDAPSSRTSDCCLRSGL